MQDESVGAYGGELESSWKRLGIFKDLGKKLGLGIGFKLTPRRVLMDSTYITSMTFRRKLGSLQILISHSLKDTI